MDIERVYATALLNVAFCAGIKISILIECIETEIFYPDLIRLVVNGGDASVNKKFIIVFHKTTNFMSFCSLIINE